MSMLKCNFFLIKVLFSASLLQSSVSLIFRNQYNVVIYDQETFLIIINVENSCAAQYFCGNCDIYIFSESQKKFKRTAFI